MTNRRTLFAAFYTVDPPMGGAGSVTYNLARHWDGKKLLVQIGPSASRHTIEPGLDCVTLGQPGDGGRWRKLAQIRRWCSEMARLATEFRPGTIVLEGASWSVYLWLLARQLRAAVPAAKIIYHAHNVEYDLRLHKHSRAVAALTRKAEAALLATADVVTAVSEVDARRFSELYGATPVLLPNGIDLDWLQGIPQSAIDAVRQQQHLPEQTVLFMGSYLYRPNGQAIDFLMKRVFPAVVERVPSARLLIVGGEVPYSMPWLITPGLVASKELPAFLASAAMSVAPIFSGSGTRLKILESLGAGVPVIGTAKAAEGLPVDECEGFVRAETEREFVDSLCAELVRAKIGKRPPFPEAIPFGWPGIVERVSAEFGQRS